MPRKRKFNCKIVVVGDRCTNKTGLLISYTSGSYPTEYVPTVFDNFTAHLRVNDIDVTAGLWDTSGQEDYDRLRPQSYPQTDIFLLLFSINQPETLKNAKERWFTELKKHCSTTPFLLVGVNQEQRDNVEDAVSYEQGKEAANAIEAVGYYECSAKTGYNVHQVFDAAIKNCLIKAGFYKQQNDISESSLLSSFIFIEGDKKLLFQAPIPLNEPVVTTASIEPTNSILPNQTRSDDMINEEDTIDISTPTASDNDSPSLPAESVAEIPVQEILTHSAPPLATLVAFTPAISAENDAKPKIYSSGIELTKMQELIIESGQKIASAKGKKVCLVIGNTGVGKSTIINKLLDVKFVRKPKQGDRYAYYAEPQGKLFAEVAHDDISKTFYPQVYGNGNDCISVIVRALKILGARKKGFVLL